MGAQDVGNAAVEAFDHTVGLRGSGFDKAMLDAVAGTELIAGMGAGWLALTRADGTERA